jgi:hypothetical protein
MESKQQKPKRKILQIVMASILIGAMLLWVAATIATESTDNKPFLTNLEYTDQSGILLKVQ